MSADTRKSIFFTRILACVHIHEHALYAAPF
ncbi:Uncharacterised protein [Streptococcus sobrinus]|nr:Uncharacterised protein [Streptococcus sobrinus]